MKKVMMFTLVLVMAMSVMSAYAGAGKKGAACKGKALSKSLDQNVAQAAAGNIQCWGKSRGAARGQSLRGNKAELARRMGR